MGPVVGYSAWLHWSMHARPDRAALSCRHDHTDRVRAVAPSGLGHNGDAYVGTVGTEVLDPASCRPLAARYVCRGAGSTPSAPQTCGEITPTERREFKLRAVTATFSARP